MSTFSKQLAKTINKARKYGFDVSYKNGKYVFTIDDLPNQVLLNPFSVSISELGNELDKMEYQILEFELDNFDEIEMKKIKTESLRRSAFKKLTDEEIIALGI